MSAPVMRSPLYIPAFPTPGKEAAVEDEGVIEPQLLTTTEFAVPSPMEPAAAKDDGLPWIDAFLASTPAAAVPAVGGEDIDAPIESAAIQGTAIASAVFEAPMVEASAAEMRDVDAPTVDSPSSDEWPLDEAASEFRTFSAQLEGTDTTVARPFAPAPLPEWSDDDLMDIMPVRQSGTTPLSKAATQPSDAALWSDRAQRAEEEAQVIRAMASAQAAAKAASAVTAPEATAEEAAHALELLARRVRAGELMLPSYDPRMGEPAALVAALAALLGVRLR